MPVNQTTQLLSSAMSEQLNAIARLTIVSIIWSCAGLLDKDRSTDVQQRAGPEIA